MIYERLACCTFECGIVEDMRAGCEMICGRPGDYSRTC